LTYKDRQHAGPSSERYTIDFIGHDAGRALAAKDCPATAQLRG
jgi:hypothetical protein